MIANDPISATFEPFQASGVAAPWAGLALSEQAVVGGKRILLVEDDEPLRGFVRVMLELEGHQVTEASNGAEALSLFTMGEFDLVITDFEMPVMKGNEFAAGIKLLAASVPILMITGSERARGGVENPVDALLGKPFTVDELRREVAKLLSAQPDPAQSSAVLV